MFSWPSIKDRVDYFLDAYLRIRGTVRNRLCLIGALAGAALLTSPLWFVILEYLFEIQFNLSSPSPLWGIILIISSFYFYYISELGERISPNDEGKHLSENRHDVRVWKNLKIVEEAEMVRWGFNELRDSDSINHERMRLLNNLEYRLSRPENEPISTELRSACSVLLSSLEVLTNFVATRFFLGLGGFNGETLYLQPEHNIDRAMNHPTEEKQKQYEIWSHELVEKVDALAAAHSAAIRQAKATLAIDAIPNIDSE